MKKYVLLLLTLNLLFIFCRAQVAVSAEPMHHKILENSHVRLLDVHILPGDTTQFHIHATPSVFVVLTSVKTGSQVVQQEDHSKFADPRYGNIYFEGFYQIPRIHRVWNEDNREFRVMDIELPNKKFKEIDAPLRNDAFQFLFEENPVRAYRLTLLPGTKISLLPRKADVLIILLTDSADQVTANHQSVRAKGDFGYIPSGKDIEIFSSGTGKAEFAFFELK